MPGILPMKVIKMGTSAQARIAQACDRCRSKKIKCDGERPCCSQCAAVGFECKTSDKLSRRAFPRGYTESLEERVRALESEVRELKDLLDEKDEKIDILSRINPQRASISNRTPSPRQQHPSPVRPRSEEVESPSDDDVSFRVQQSPYLMEHVNADSYFVGTSSGSSFVESFKQKVQEKGRSGADIKPTSILPTASSRVEKPIEPVLHTLQSRAPPRLVSDQLVNVFFQEWAPLFPVLHRPTFLSLYEDFTTDPASVTDKRSIAQIYLVFTLAALSNKSQHASDIPHFEVQWRSALHHVHTEQSLPTLQCLLLAQLACMQKGDCSQLLTYKALATSLSARFGLHQSQKRYALGTLTCETRKRVFWTLYTIDSFSAVMLGLPQQIKDSEVFCEYPVDADDEYITEKGFQPILPGESTRVSSALALFRAARILSKVLDEIYPALPSFEVSLRKLSALEEELNQWQASLAPHLRLPFAQDKPTVGTVSSRSPLLALTYHYIRGLIHRPAVCAAVDSQSSMLAMAGSCKHVAQVLALLTERGLSFSFCLNKEELLVLSGVGLLMQGLDLPEDSKVLKDTQKTLALVIGQLDQMKAGSAATFRNIACSTLSIHPARTVSKSHTSTARPSSKPATSTIPTAMKEQFKAMTQKFDWFSNKPANPNAQRRLTHTGLYKNSAMSQSQPAFAIPEARHSRSEPARSPDDSTTSAVTSSVRTSVPPLPGTSPCHSTSSRPSVNLDYLPFTETKPVEAPQQLPSLKRQPTDWERLLANIDNGQSNIFDNIYGGPPVDILNDARSSTTSLPQQSTSNYSNSDLAADNVSGWDPDIWAADTADLVSLTTNPATMTESVFSLSSGDDFAGSLVFDDGGSMNGELEKYGGIMMPDFEHDDGIWAGGQTSFTIG